LAGNIAIADKISPGEALPEFPAATHSRNGEDRLKPFVSVNHTLRQIPASAPDHNIAAAKLKDEVPWDGDQILPRTMTCSGGQNYHPSGKRDFTDREYAALQGFPEDHWFKGAYIKRQIGNAVPPCIAKVLFESIKKTLNNADGIEEEHETLLIE
jgi:DNA (cytosine-5)-methyltransferase 1